jgi:hypothetical protein
MLSTLSTRLTIFFCPDAPPLTARQIAVIRIMTQFRLIALQKYKK